MIQPQSHCACSSNFIQQKSPTPQPPISAKSDLSMRLQGLEPWTNRLRVLTYFFTVFFRVFSQLRPYNPFDFVLLFFNLQQDCNIFLLWFLVLPSKMRCANMFYSDRISLLSLLHSSSLVFTYSTGIISAFSGHR